MKDTKKSDDNILPSCSQSPVGPMASYRAWCSMIQRCHNPNHPSFKDYGEKGREVCSRWRNSYQTYRDDLGPRPTAERTINGKLIYSVNRIDNEGDYEPGNCEWATDKDQSLNRSNTIKTEFEGKMVTADELSEKTGVSRKLISQRIKAGKSGDDLLLPPHRVVLELDGEKYTTAELARKFNVPQSLIVDRLRHGKTVREAIIPGLISTSKYQVEYKEEILSIPELSKRTGIEEDCLRARYHKGERGEDLVRPVQQKTGYLYKGTYYSLPRLSEITGVPKTTLERNMCKTQEPVDEIVAYLVHKRDRLGR